MLPQKYQPARGPGRPPLPEGDALDMRRTVRLDATDAALLRALARTLGVTEVEALRVAMRELAARKVKL